jgi:uncharacterized glyoxalase superfamily protein PhnB
MSELMLDDIERGLSETPSPRFRARLKAELMETQSVIAYVIVPEADALIDFTVALFDAEELMRTVGSAGGRHAEVRIGDSKLMLGGGVATREPNPAALHVYVDDVDRAHKRALELGASEIMPPTDQPYGERGSSLNDPFGNQWYLATPLGGEKIPRGLRSVNVSFHPTAASDFIDFLERAVNAETILRYEDPPGTVRHAELRIGNSMIEIGAAHGPYQPMKSAIYLVTDDADAAYEQAIDAGATMIWAPADQAHGARIGAVADPAGNTWFLSSPVKK